MKRRWVSWLLIVLVLGLLPLVGLASSDTGGPVYKLEWMDAWYENSTLVLPKTVTPTNISLSPARNDTTVQRLKVTFSFSGKEEATVPPNTVEIRIPNQLYYNAAGNLTGTNVVPLPMNTSFNYRVDTATNEIVIYNFNEINEALVFTVEVDYKVRPSDVRLPSSPNETILPYEKTFDAQVTIKRPNTEPVITHTPAHQPKL